MSEEKELVVEETTEVTSNPMDEVVRDPNAPIITMKRLLEAGSHFGHQTRRWNPKMKKFIYSSRNGVYIIDLGKTVEGINKAYAALYDIVKANGKVLFVGTKPQCQAAVQAEAERSGSFYITNRWLGGTLTNFRTINSRIKFLKDIEKRDEEQELDLLPKTEANALRKEKEKLAKNLNGIKEMRKVPEAIFVVDPNIEHNAVAEARKLNIPVFGIVDTNSNPDLVDYPIPANDDAIRSVSLIVALIADAIVEAKGGLPVCAYIKDEGEDVTMKEVIRQTDKENREKLERIRAERAAHEAERIREQQLREASQDKAKAVIEEEKTIKKTRKPTAKKVTEAPKEEAATEKKED